MVASGCSLFIEIGTHPILSHYVHETFVRQKVRPLLFRP
ncbi:hypothetical protein C2W62_28135 [Candidatus Entotheonella serta]|nr:hypothetical protein C2W62_28135 [Candidatus Entotheonella serta]